MISTNCSISNKLNCDLSLLLSVLIFIYLLIYFRKPKNLNLKKWHVFGMISTVLANIHQFHDYATRILIHKGGAFMLKGLWFANMDMLVTTDPLDINHILSKNFSSYPKGENFREIFDIFGDGILNNDGDLWKNHRKTTLSLFRHPEFQSVLEATMWNKIEKGLLLVLESVSKLGSEIDLQEIFQRFTFDTMCKLLLDHDFQSLSLDFPCIPCEKVITDIEVAIFYRHLFPTTVWKVQKLLRIHNEKKLRNAWKVVDRFVYEYLARKQCDFVTSNHNEMKTYGIVEECMEGKIKHEPSYKFPAFNAGPRACLGKDMSLSQIKIVATKIIYHYRIELVEGHPVVPSESIVLQMKHGLKVRLANISEAKI